MNSNSPSDQSVPVDFLIDDIYSMLAEAGLPGSCAVCQTQCQTVQDITINHDDFRAVIPLRVCRSCGESPTLTSRDPNSMEVGVRWGIALAVLFLLGQEWILASICLAATAGIFFWNRRNLRGRDQTRMTTLHDLLSSVPSYQLLLERDVVLSRPSRFGRPELEPEYEAKRFARSVLMKVQYSLLTTKEELQKAAIPSVVLESYFEIIDTRMTKVIREFPKLGSGIIQVGVVLLPGRKFEFDIATATETGSSKSLRDRLKLGVESIPTWPVAYPVVFLLQRYVGTPRQKSFSKLSPPFVVWGSAQRGVPGDENMTYAQMALQFYQSTSANEPVLFQLEDIDALCSCLPENVPLKLYRAWLLRAERRMDEALIIYDNLLGKHPIFEESITLERATCLAEAGQLEHAAALCQQQISRQSDNSHFRGLLAEIQLNLKQPEEALQTIDGVVSNRHESGVLHLRAVILLELNRFDEARSSLNLAIFQNQDFAPAYLLRARLCLIENRVEDALTELKQFERCGEPTLESLQLKASALVAAGRGQEAEQSYRRIIEECPENLVLRLQLAEFLAQTGKLELGKQECDTIIAQMDQFAAAFGLRSAIFLEMQEFAAAVSDANQALELGANGAHVWMVRGIAKVALGKVEQGFEDLDTCVEILPDYALARLHRGRLRSQLEEYETAIAEFTLALELFPKWTEALLERGYGYLGMDQPFQARDDFQKAIDVSPDCAPAYTGRAITFLVEGDKAAAAADLDMALDLDPGDVTGRMNRARLHLENHEGKLARKDLDEILAVEPNSSPALFQRAHIHLSLGEYEDAKRDFDRLIEMNPNIPEVFVGRSVALEQVGDEIQAEADQEQARQLAPFSVEELALSRALLAASVANRNEQFEKAIELATEAIDEHAEPLWNAYRIRGHANWYSENFVAALEDYAFIIEQSDESTRHDFNAYGQVLAELGEFEQALEPLERSVKLAEEDRDQISLAFSLNGKGRALAGLGRFDEAEECFSKSLELKSNNAWLHFNRGLLYLETGQQRQALECFQLALSVDSPRLSPAKRRRAEGVIRALQGSRFHQDSESFLTE